MNHADHEAWFAFSRAWYSRAAAWNALVCDPRVFVVHGKACTIPLHWWRKYFDNDRAWCYYAVFAPHLDGPDERTNYRGEVERGFNLPFPRHMNRAYVIP